MSTTVPNLDAIARLLPRGYAARPFRDEDREALVAIGNAEAHPVQQESAEEWRRWEALMPDPTALRLVVEATGAGIVGGANVSTGGPFPAPDGSARGGLRVAADHRRRGIGSALLPALEEDARRRGAPFLRSGARADQPVALDWALKRGYREIGRRIQAFVDLTRFDPKPWEERHRRPLANGIRFATVAELLAGRDEAAREDLYHGIWEAEREPFEDVPVATPMSHWPYDAFRRTWDSPGAAPDLSILAFDGDEIVGMTTSYRSEGDKAGTGFTGVARAHRGRGIAFALKVDALRRAKAAGLRWMTTTNDEPNKAMRGINYELGYEMLPAHVQVEKKL